MTDHTLGSPLPATMAAVPPTKATFRERVRAETRLTWSGRWRWLWRAAAGVLVLLSLPLPWNPATAIDFHLFAVLSAVVPAWLFSDLLSIRTRENPEPLREWAPSEFAARAIGRLLPFMLTQGVWVSLFVAGTLAQGVGKDSSNPPGMDDLNIHHWSQFPNWWVAWTAVFLISSLTYAAWAGLLSAAVRRPRRWAITLITTLVFTHLGTVVLSTAMQHGDGFATNLVNGSWAQVLAIMPPNVWLGVLSARVLLDHWPRLAPDRWDLSWICWSASVMWLLYALVPALLTWRIAARRYGRTIHTDGEAT